MISDNVPYSFPCAGNGMSENYEVNVLQMEKVLVSWPEPGLHKTSSMLGDKKWNPTSQWLCYF